jgi:hypothetical protein
VHKRNRKNRHRVVDGDSVDSLFGGGEVGGEVGEAVGGVVDGVVDGVVGEIVGAVAPPALPPVSPASPPTTPTLSPLASDSSATSTRMTILPEEIRLLTVWIAYINIYKKATYQSSVWYKQWDTALGILPVIMNAVVILIKGYEFWETESAMLKYASFALILLTTIISAIGSFLKLSAQSENMRHICVKLTDLELVLQIYLAQSSIILVSPVDFIHNVHRDIVTLVKEAGSIPTAVMRLWVGELNALDIQTIPRMVPL